MEIAKGIARGLTCLHDDIRIIHGNLTASNVLLDERCHPKVVDFGLFLLLTPIALVCDANLPATAPEMSRPMYANTKTDVYGLGVILLELLTGMLPSSMDLPEWVARKEWSSDIFDQQLIQGEDAGLLGDQLEETLILALKCVDPSPSARPLARVVLWKLGQISSGWKNATRPSQVRPPPQPEVKAWDNLENVRPGPKDGAGTGPSMDDLSLLARINVEGVPEAEQEVLDNVHLSGHVEQSSSEWRKQQPANLFQASLRMDHHSGGGLPKNIPFHLLEEITNGFPDERKLGSGGFGEVYMGVHKDGEKIAVKMLHNKPGLDEEQFLNEFNSLSRLQHPNIVRLVGYCHEIQKTCVKYNGRFIFAERIRLALCIEYMPSGSLDKYLSDEYDGLHWNVRYTLIKGICKGLKYLHEELRPPIYHLDLKPANILLDENMLPKIADFGLSRFFADERTQITKSYIGTL
ncbi:hypothetical protein HU200_029155 [Digitaria exilis]|uniref:non-specific serine/threonine protein kinase n=1 Tax=Digitaria exilis TaxID=1010633 RepID=A0A835ERR7_9POAL|nr:hypothetical protein HU200_029155 [Digitaria exilis]